MNQVSKSQWPYDLFHVLGPLYCPHRLTPEFLVHWVISLICVILQTLADSKERMLRTDWEDFQDHLNRISCFLLQDAFRASITVPSVAN